MEPIINSKSEEIPLGSLDRYFNYLFAVESYPGERVEVACACRAFLNTTRYSNNIPKIRNSRYNKELESAKLLYKLGQQLDEYINEVSVPEYPGLRSYR